MDERSSRTWCPAPTASALANEAATRGLRPPLKLSGSQGTARGWLLLEASPDALYADEYGELWWGRRSRSGAVQLIRRCWPEEERSLARTISAAVEALSTSIAGPV